MLEISRKVLCVDDDENILKGLKRQFRNKFDITTAAGGHEALRTLLEQGPFAVVMSDYQMPEMNGVQVLQQVHELSPESVLVMLTSLADVNVVVSALHEGHIFRFLNKPCPTQMLESTLDDCLEQYRLSMSERILSAELNRANEQLHTLNENLEIRVLERTTAIQQLYQFVAHLNELDTLEAVADLIVMAVSERLKSHRVSLMMPDSGNEYLYIVASIGVEEELKQRIRVPIGSPIAGMVYAESHDLVVNEVGQLPRNRDRYDCDVFASVPLVSTSLSTSTRTVGVLNVTEREGGQPYDEDCLAELKAITEAASIALSNQIRRQERNDARDAVILALAKLAEHRDPETGAHLERVQSYCRLLSKTLADMPQYAQQINSEFINDIVRSSPLHDIGKVGVPDNILLKPGRLTAEEFEIMKRHSTIGGDILRNVVEKGRRQKFLEMGMLIAYFHHERFDGTGYPSRLRGKDIPLPARILALADVYDALTSKRVYKEAMPHEEAVGLIRVERGKHFDPDIVEAFDQCEQDFAQLARDLADGNGQVLSAGVPALVGQT